MVTAIVAPSCGSACSCNTSLQKKPLWREPAVGPGAEAVRSVLGLGRFRCSLGRLLAGADLHQGLGINDVRHREIRAFLAVVPGSLPPARRLEAPLFAQQGKENLCLLLTEAWQCFEPAEDLRTVRTAL